MTVPANGNPHGSRKRLGRLVRWLWGAGALLVLLLAPTLLNNNYSLRPPSRDAFNRQLDHALDNALTWITDNAYISERNPSIMYMIADIERMSHEPRLQHLLDHYQTHYLAHPADVLDPIWFRLVVRNADVPAIYPPDSQGSFNERLWDAYAVAPDKVSIAADDRASMFSPTKYWWGARQHQILALIMYRDYNGGSPELDSTLDYLAEKIARDAHYDFRLNDSYIQRTTFVLGAGRPDLIRPRWVDRILDHQNADGSWNSCWYGWCRGVFEFRIDNGGDGHATVQAAWALTMLKYRYPQWIDQHYR